LTNNFIYASYSNGSPVWAVDTSILNVNGRDKILAAIAFRNGTSVDVLPTIGTNTDTATKRARRLFNIQGFEHANGLEIAGSGRNFSLTAGAVYWVDNLIQIPAYDSALATFQYCWRNGAGGWNRTPANEIGNTEYDNGTGTLATFNQYRADYVYLLVDTPTRCLVVMGQQNYNTLDAAKAGSYPPVLPPELAQYGLSKCVGRIIIGKNAVTMTTETPFRKIFSTTGG
jgi:hypothetical protein